MVGRNPVSVAAREGLQAERRAVGTREQRTPPGKSLEIRCLHRCEGIQQRDPVVEIIDHEK